MVIFLFVSEVSRDVKSEREEQAFLSWPKIWKSIPLSGNIQEWALALE